MVTLLGGLAVPDEIPFGRRADGPQGRRRARREPITVAVSLFSVDQSRVVLLSDISSTGCRLCGPTLPGVGRDVLVKAGPVELFGQIMWAAETDRGIEFDEPIDEARLQQLRAIEASQLDLGWNDRGR